MWLGIDAVEVYKNLLKKYHVVGKPAKRIVRETGLSRNSFQLLETAGNLRRISISAALPRSSDRWQRLRKMLSLLRNHIIKYVEQTLNAVSRAQHRCHRLPAKSQRRLRENHRKTGTQLILTLEPQR
jgi:hypothetical protein